MKKRVFIVAVGVSLVLSLVGCGKEVEEIEQPKLLDYSSEIEVEPKEESKPTVTEEVTSEESTIDWDAGHTEEWGTIDTEGANEIGGNLNGDIISITYCNRTVKPFQSFHFDVNLDKRTIEYLCYRGATIKDAENDPKRQQGVREDVPEGILDYIKVAYDNNLITTSETQICDLFCYTLSTYCTEDPADTYSTLTNDTVRISIGHYDTDNDDLVSFEEYAYGIFKELSNELFIDNLDTLTEEEYAHQRADIEINECISSDLYKNSTAGAKNDLLITKLEILKGQKTIKDYQVTEGEVKIIHADDTEIVMILAK